MSKQKKKPANWYRILGAVWYLLFLGVITALGIAAGWVSKSQVATALVKQGLMHTPPEQVFDKDGVTLLILGCDEDRYYGGEGPNMKPGKVLRKYARADMILVARLDFKSGTVSGLSIPRDTEVDLPDYRPMKINRFHAIAKKGEEAALTIRAVQEVIPVNIDRVLTLDYDAFQHMVNLVGGVTVDVKKPMKYRDIRGGLNIDLDPGTHKLNGYDSMSYVRFRKADSDFERQKRQKEFLVSFKNAVIRRPQAMTAVLEEARAFIGNALTPEEIASLAFFGRKVPSDQIKLGQVPVLEGRGTNLDVDRAKLPAALEEFGLANAPGIRP